MLDRAARGQGLPLWFALATVIAESGLNPRAERWGSETPAAKAALAAQNWPALQAVINRAGADISFSYGQQIILYHYVGTRQPTIENCLAVREHVFNNPEENLTDMCKRLAANFLRVAGDPRLSYVGGDQYLGALLVYNSGSLQTDPAWWKRWGSNIASYRDAIVRAKQMVGNA